MTSKVVYLGQLRTEIIHCASGQKSITDAPLDNQGKGEAFSPTDLMATSLASCMLTVVGIRAKDMNLDISGTYAEVEKIMVSNPRRVGQLNVKIYFKKVKEKGLKSLFQQIALACPVAKSLHIDVVQNVEFYFGD